MLFSSIDFICVFLPVVWLAYFLIGSRSAKNSKILLIFASLFFYGYWKPIYLPIIIISVLVNFSLGRLLSVEGEQRLKKTFLIVGILLNVGLLIVFKYSDFFITNVNNILGTDIAFIKLVLPLAISFFTFQQIAYLVDSYKGLVKDYNLVNYFLFVTFFPQLIAGPIVHHKEMMPQFIKKNNLKINLDNIAKGIIIFSIGLFKKIVVADHFGVYADLGYANVDQLNFWGAWSTSMSYTVQLYYDFSGYCDMAIGAALLFNIKLPINFNSPYKALNIQDFWRRWHITLSTWLRDYIYIPFGGNRKGEFKTYRNLLLTFLIGGFWHGAGWGFVLWGAIHGIGLTVHRLWQEAGYRLPKILAWLFTITFVHIAWVFFRAENLSDAAKVLNKMFEFTQFDFAEPKLMQSIYLLGINQINGPYVFLLSGVFLIFAVLLKNSIEICNEYKKSQNTTAILAGLAFSISLIIMTGSSSQTFLYFNF